MVVLLEGGEGGVLLEGGESGVLKKLFSFRASGQI